MRELTEDGRRVVEDLARRHGVSPGAVETLLQALAAGGGTQAQFSHPELGGMGQWSSGGMLMIGDMFNDALKARVGALAADLAEQLRSETLLAPMRSAGAGFTMPAPSAGRWPADLGDPASAGSQNDLHYAVFPSTRRLAIERGGQVTVYDTADHRITGISQQQSGDQSLTFTSQHGPVRAADLKVVTAPAARAAEDPAAPEPAAGRRDDVREADIFAKIERLHELRQKDIITAQEFEAKKADLLGRL
jgi:hypothetical protein